MNKGDNRHKTILALKRSPASQGIEQWPCSGRKLPSIQLTGQYQFSETNYVRLLQSRPSIQGKMPSAEFRTRGQRCVKRRTALEAASPYPSLAGMLRDAIMADKDHSIAASQKPYNTNRTKTTTTDDKGNRSEELGNYYVTIT